MKILQICLKKFCECRPWIIWWSLITGEKKIWVFSNRYWKSLIFEIVLGDGWTTSCICHQISNQIKFASTIRNEICCFCIISSVSRCKHTIYHPNFQLIWDAKELLIGSNAKKIGQNINRDSFSFFLLYIKG